MPLIVVRERRERERRRGREIKMGISRKEREYNGDWMLVLSVKEKLKWE